MSGLGLLAAFWAAPHTAHAQAKSADALDSAGSLYKDAGAAFDRGDVEQAIALYQKLVAMRPESVEPRTNLGVALAHVGRYDGHAGSIMASYKEIVRIPSHVNHWLLDTVLRWEWGFDGYVTSDGDGLQMLVKTHHVAGDFGGPRTNS